MASTVLQETRRACEVGTRLDVDSQDLLEVFVEPAKHLVRLVHLRRTPIEPVVITQHCDAAHVDAGDGCRTEIYRHSVRLLEVECGQEAFLAVHSHAADVP